MEQQSPTNLWKNITADTNMSFPQDAGQLSESSESTIFLDQEDDQPDDLSPGVTKTIHKLNPLDKKKYHYISHNMRLDLIDAIENKGQKIKFAAKNLGINYSSAKSIYQVFKREGRSDKKTFKRRNYKDEHSTQTPTEPTSVGMSLDPYSALPSIEAINQVKILEEEPKDSLTILRDRLLASRTGPSQNLDAYKLAFQKDYPSYYSIPLPQNSQLINAQMTAPLSEIKNPQQFDLAKSNLNEDCGIKIPQQQYPVQQINGFAASSDPLKISMQNYTNQAVYFVPSQMMAPMMMTSSQGTSSFNNFNSIGQQNMTFSGPSQTININQPSAKNISFQTINLSDNKTNPMDVYAKEPVNQVPQMINASQMQIPQPQYCPVGFANPMMNQMGGVQAMPPRVFMVSQGNLVPVNTYPQMMQSNMGFPMYGQNYMSIQTNPGYPFGNTQSTMIDQKMRPNMMNMPNIATNVKVDESMPLNK